ncbi:MAG TPA: siderophore-interacting protein [Polaromonas sp.]|nr:siderophore-interacting protein [Polaromonas sp.]
MIFEGRDLADFQSLSFDDHVKIALPLTEGRTELRDFTPLDFDSSRAQLTIDFALHENGPASNWARRALPGSEVMILGPRGSMVLPKDFPWEVLAGDASALPAITRRMRQLPDDVRVTVLAQIDHPSDERPLATRANAQVTWVRSTDEWLALLRALTLPAGEGHIWCAGEAQTMKAARSIFLDHHKHPRSALRVAAYWKHGAPGFHEKLDS